METETLSKQETANVLKTNEELQEKIAVLETRLSNLKEQNQMLQSGMRMAGIDQLPKEVIDMAKARMTAGLREDQAIQKSIEQYQHDQKLAAAATASATGTLRPEAPREEPAGATAGGARRK